MYLIIPIVVFALSLAGLLFLVFRKFVYLKKITPEAISNPPATMKSFWTGLFPEIISLFDSVNWRGHRVGIMSEFEKILRRLRLIFLKIDSLTHRLINRLRRSTKHHEAILIQEEASEAKEEEMKPVVLDPKEEEQHLIMEIAKNPKDAMLYQKLGDIYIKTGETENARMSFQTVLDLDPENWYAKKKLRSLPEPVVKPE